MTPLDLIAACPLVEKWRKEAEEFGKIYKETGQDAAFRINAIRTT